MSFPCERAIPFSRASWSRSDRVIVWLSWVKSLVTIPNMDWVSLRAVWYSRVMEGSAAFIAEKSLMENTHDRGRVAFCKPSNFIN